MFTYSYYIYYRRENVLAYYNNTIHNTRTMHSDIGPACTIVVHGKQRNKSRKKGPGGEVVRDDISNEKQRNITK